MKYLLLAFVALGSSAAAAPAPSLTISPATAIEGTQRIILSVCKHGTINSLPSTATFKMTAGTALAGSDFIAATGTLTFPAAKSCQEIIVTLVDDTLLESPEAFTVTIKAGTNARLYRGTATATITDDDIPPPPPMPSWIAYPAGTPWSGLNIARHARATKDCSSIYRTTETDRVGIFFLGVKIGDIYSLLTVDTLHPVPSWGWTSARNIAGQNGDTWTLQATPEPITVVQECLEGVRQQ